MAAPLLASPVDCLFGNLAVPIAIGSVIVLFLLPAILVGYACYRRPESVARLLLWLPAHLFYRIRVFGRENVPATGAALLVCNYLSYLDAFLVFLAQKRPVRFVVWAADGRLPSFLLRLARAITIDGSGDPRAIVRSLRTASEALAKGELVCIFADGAITRTGFLLPFHRGLEMIVKRSSAPIIPVRLERVWGSLLSYRGSKLLWKWPQTLPYPVTMAFGRAMPPTAAAVDVRLAIQKLSADCAVARRQERRPVHRQFIYLAARHPLRSCLIDSHTGRSFRYIEVLAGCWILTQKLRPILSDTPMVGVWLPSSVGGAFANIVLAFLGKTSVNLNYTSSKEGIQSAIQQCGVRQVLTSRLFTSKVPLDPGPGVELIYLEDFRAQVSTGQRLRALLGVALLPAFVLERWVLRLAVHKPDDLATVIFSSGSTGDPKGVMLSHDNLAANAESMVQAIDPGPSDRIVGILPFFHSFGYTVTLWVPLQVGASVVYYPDPRQAKEIGQLCKDYSCTIFLTTPTFLRFCLRRCEPDNFRTVRILMSGAEKLPQALAQEFKEKFGVQPLEGYGCTELSPTAAANVPDWEQYGVRQIGSKPGTIGQTIPGVAAKIVDPDTLAPLPPDKEGMLLIYGANVMKGYLGRPELTREVIHDGWYVTGDLAKFDQDGFITITDRLARFSKIGGEMVPHQKIEDELHEILGTCERVCLVTSVPDERRGERLVVLHTPVNGLNPHLLWNRLRDRGLPSLWIPSEKDFVQIAEMPLLGSGKVDLKRARELAREKVHPSSS